MVDVEASGPCPGLYDMTEIGLIVIREGYPVEEMPSFYGQFSPMSDNYIQEALDVCERTWEEVKAFPDPELTTKALAAFIESEGGTRPMMVSDNPAFDFQFVNYYCWKFLGHNPFGHSAMSLGSLYKGMVKNTFKNFKKLRKTKHTHDPVMDCRGNVEALLYMVKEMGLGINLK